MIPTKNVEDKYLHNIENKWNRKKLVASKMK